MKRCLFIPSAEVFRPNDQALQKSRSGRAGAFVLARTLIRFLFLALPLTTWADSPQAAPLETGLLEVAIRHARSLLKQEKLEEAISALKEMIEKYPDAVEPRWLLVSAYLRDQNELWALRTLTRLAELSSNDCEPSLWQSWILLKQRELKSAREMLSSVQCPPENPASTRQWILRAMVAKHLGENEQAKQHVASARKNRFIHEEDLMPLQQLTSTLDPGYIIPLSGKMELSLGWASNARAGSPVDPAAMESIDSSLVGQVNLGLRFVGPTGRFARPSLEAETRMLGYAAEGGRDLSYLMLSGRPGLLLGDIEPNLLLAYRFDALLLAGSDRYENGPLWFYNAHRFELESSLFYPNLSLFGGAGRRIFREIGRSRTEVDGGLGLSFLLHSQIRLLAALSGRWHKAEKPSYDLRGGTLLISTEIRLPRDLSVRVGALTALDAYPNSAGYFDALAPDTARRDVLLKLSLSAFSPSFKGLKIGATYEFAKRFSTADPYDYLDHRLLIKGLFNFSHDPWAPKVKSTPTHVPLEHQLAPAGFEERLQDLLRQDEAAQRSSSCVE